MKRLIKISIALFLLGGISGCATVGAPFDFKGSDSLVIGKTVKADVLRQYGEPFRVGYDSGNLKWTYGYYKYRLFGSSDTKDLVITFDKKGYVKDYSYSTSLEDEKWKVMNTDKN
jgi:hypothetical protein